MRKLKISDFIEKDTGKLIWYKESNRLFNIALKYPSIASKFIKKAKGEKRPKLNIKDAVKTAQSRKFRLQTFRTIHFFE